MNKWMNELILYLLKYVPIHEYIFSRDQPAFAKSTNSQKMRITLHHIISRITPMIPRWNGCSQEHMTIINQSRVHVKRAVIVTVIVIVIASGCGWWNRGGVMEIKGELRHAGGSFDRRTVSFTQNHGGF